MDKRLFDNLLRAAASAAGAAPPPPSPPQTGVVIEGRITHGIYEGPDPCLLGKRALIRTSQNYKDKVLAQFDDTSLREAFGWHAFDVEDFELCVTLDI